MKRLFQLTILFLVLAGCMVCYSLGCSPLEVPGILLRAEASDGTAVPESVPENTAEPKYSATEVHGIWVATAYSIDYPSSQTTDSAALKADDVLGLIYELKRPYRKNASFIMNDKTVAQIRKFKDNNGAYIWQPSYQAGEPDRILGYSVHTSEYVPENAIAFGDYSYYNIGDRGTRSFKQLTELFAGNGMIGYVAKERVDGKLILPEAVQILKLKTE